MVNNFLFYLIKLIAAEIVLIQISVFSLLIVKFVMDISFYTTQCFYCQKHVCSFSFMHRREVHVITETRALVSCVLCYDLT